VGVLCKKHSLIAQAMRFCLEALPHLVRNFIIKALQIVCQEKNVYFTRIFFDLLLAPPTFLDENTALAEQLFHLVINRSFCFVRELEESVTEKKVRS
jgi:hypothetical protein